MTKKQFIETLKNIKNYCKLTKCSHCRFSKEYSILCGFRVFILALNMCPEDWNIEEIERIIKDDFRRERITDD